MNIPSTSASMLASLTILKRLAEYPCPNRAWQAQISRMDQQLQVNNQYNQYCKVYLNL